MTSVRALGIFCEDIRQEVAGTHTIIGVLPDNLNVAAVPFAMPKLGSYVRVAVPSEGDTVSLSVLLKLPDGTEQSVTTIEDALINKAKAEGRENGVGFGSIIAQAIGAPFPIPKFGQLQLIVRAGTEDVICAVLNIREAPKEASAKAG